MSHTLTASAAAELIRTGKLTSEALVSACLERIAAREHEVNAWTWLDPDAALALARAADRKGRGGALHGVPIGVKDIIDTSDMPTGLGFAPYVDRRPVWDAGCVAACRRAGAIILGKTVTTEFAYFAAGKTRNPHDLTATPGGSSSGSAAAVADNMVPLAFGSQTAASLIRPAAFCGVVGYKASHAEFSLSGIRPFSESFDSLGVLSRSVEDAMLLRDVLLGRQTATAVAADAGKPRLGVCRTDQWRDLEPGARTAFDSAVERLAKGGADVGDIVLPSSFEALMQAHRSIMAYEAAHNYAFEHSSFSAELSPAFTALCDAGHSLGRTGYLAAKAQVATALADFRRVFEGWDAWIAPSALGEAPLAAQGTGDPAMSRIWTALQAPCLSLPIGRGSRGLPLGAQLIALPGMDDTLLRAGVWASGAL